MKRLLPIVLALLTGTPALASEGYDFAGIKAIRYIRSNSKFCKIDNFVVLTSIPEFQFSSCADPDTFLRTSDGGRVQIFNVSHSDEEGWTYGSYAIEVNCKTMENRSIPEIWSFRKNKPKTSFANKWKLVEKLGWWKGTRSWNWSDWEVMQKTSDDSDYICKRWRKDTPLY